MRVVKDINPESQHLDPLSIHLDGIAKGLGLCMGYKSKARNPLAAENAGLETPIKRARAKKTRLEKYRLDMGPSFKNGPSFTTNDSACQFARD